LCLSIPDGQAAQQLPAWPGADVEAAGSGQQAQHTSFEDLQLLLVDGAAGQEGFAVVDGGSQILIGPPRTGCGLCVRVDLALQ
jgi:hypothetical protein